MDTSTTSALLRKMCKLLAKVGDKTRAQQVSELEARLTAADTDERRHAALKELDALVYEAEYHAGSWPEKDYTSNRYELSSLRGHVHKAVFPPKPKMRRQLSAKVPSLLNQIRAGMKVHWIEGDPSDAERIAVGTIARASEFEAALVGRNYDGAYGMIAPSTRAWMSLRRFISDHERGTVREGGGMPKSFRVEHITRIYADDAARRQPNGKGGWPPRMPREAKASTVQLWIDCEEGGGCWSFLFVAEEVRGEFSIAKFMYYQQ